MNKNKFENIATSFLEDQKYLIDNHDPYDELLDSISKHEIQERESTLNHEAYWETAKAKGLI